jgi:hypothetical protein
MALHEHLSPFSPPDDEPTVLTGALLSNEFLPPQDERTHVLHELAVQEGSLAEMLADAGVLGDRLSRLLHGLTA